MADNAFLNVFDSFRGAADVMMGFEQQQRQQRESNMQIASRLQDMDFDRQMQPLRMKLMEEESASRRLNMFGQHIGILQSVKQQAQRDAADLAISSKFDDISNQYESWRTGLAVPSAGGSAPPGSFKARATGYFPVDPSDPNYQMQGGMVGAAEWHGQPVKQEKLFTLEDFEEGKAPYVSVAMDNSENNPLPYGAQLRSPQFPGVPFRVMDTGSAFNGKTQKYGPAKGLGRIDIARRDKKGAWSGANNRDLDFEVVDGAGGGGDITPVPDGAPFGDEDSVDVTTGPQQADVGPAAAAPIDGDEVPRSMQMMRELQMTMAAYGGPQGMAARQPEKFQRAVEMLTALENDPIAQKWKVAQAQKLAREQMVAEATGKVLAAGLPVDGFKDVFEAMKSGLPIDPSSLQKRIDNEYAMKLKQAEQQKAESAELMAMSNNPLAIAGIRVGSRLSGTQSEVFQSGLARLLKLGDTAGAQQLIRDTAVGAAPTAVQNEYASAGQMLAAVKDAESALADFYKSGKATGPFKAWQLSEYTGDRDIQALKTRMAIARQAYIKATTGAAMSDSERKTYEEIFPDVTKVADQNLRQVEQLKSGLQSRVQASERAALGDLAPMLSKQDSLLTAAQPPTFSTPEEVEAAAQRGELQDGQKIMVGGRMAKWTTKPKK